LTENDTGSSRGAASPSSAHPYLVHFLIVRREPTGFESPYTCFRHSKGILPVFCARGAARRFITSRALGEGWYVRGFSVGELISLLFALHEKVEWVMFSPLPGHLLIEDALSHRTSRDNFIASLLVR
jgi:hypothetical protein